MLEKLVLHTNSEIRRQKDKYTEQTFAVSETCSDEIKALFGILILTAAKENDHLASSELFDTTLCGQWYKAGMSEELITVQCISPKNSFATNTPTKLFRTIGGTGYHTLGNTGLRDAYVLRVHSMARKFENTLSRNTFAMKLNEDLLTPWMKKRLNIQTLPQ
ncbi:hypothetical protein NPIL_186081 [Nephila pilipes]|uniref:Uncharacterized protein n=1 Tax=Nephila pilipes TaxID=299642 RepID=A0A8X6MNF9_NEPPI|nr:hypothetical protein NPIL_186081 [Nephila pilipes]